MNDPYQSNYYRGHGRSAHGHPNFMGQSRGTNGYWGNQFWDQQPGQGNWGMPYQQSVYFNQRLNPYSNPTVPTYGLNPLAQSFNPSNWQENQSHLGGPQGSCRTLVPDFNNLGPRGEHQRGSGRPRGSLGTSRSGYNNLGSRGQHQGGTGRSRGKHQMDTEGSLAQYQGDTEGSRGQQRDTGGSRGQHQRDTGGSSGQHQSGNWRSHGEHQNGTGGSHGQYQSGTEGSHGQNQSGTGGSCGQHQNGNWRSHGQHQSGTGGSRGQYQSGTEGSHGQNQSGTGGSRGQHQSGIRGSRGHHQSGTRGSRGQHQSGTRGSRGQYQSGTEGSRGQNQSGTRGSRGQNQSGTRGSRGQHQSGIGGSRGQHQSGTGGTREQHQSGTGGSRGQHQRGTGGLRGQHQRGSDGSRGHQQGTGGPPGFSGTSQSSFNNMASQSQRGNCNQNTEGSVAAPKDQQENKFDKYLDFVFLVQPNVVGLMKEFKVMFILRGLQGSGKSTVADAMSQKYQGDAVACSADHYWYNKQGEYVWKREYLQETHEKCQRKADKYCCQDKPVVIIDNTNVVHSEMNPYFQTAKKYGYIVVLVEPKTPWKLNPRELAKKNKHNLSFTYLSRKHEQFGDITPLFFGWFVAPSYCSDLRKLAKDILQDCLEIDDYKQYMAKLSGKNASNYTVNDATSMYSMTETDDHKGLHVTACFKPKEKYLGGSLYVKSKQVQDSLGHISWITIVGWVLTQSTFSGRVTLTKSQQKLWKNEDKQEKIAAQASKEVEETLSMFQDLTTDEKESSAEFKKVDVITSKQCYSSPTVPSHVTLGVATDTEQVQAKYDNRTVINLELDHHPYKTYIISNGTLRKYGDDLWVVYLNNAIKVPGLFSGYYNII